MSQPHARDADKGRERGPGQPPIGPVVKANLPPAMIEQLDAMVSDGTADSRADAIRQLLAQGLEKQSTSMTPNPLDKMNTRAIELSHRKGKPPRPHERTRTMKTTMEIRGAMSTVMPGLINDPRAIREAAQGLGTENYDMNGVVNDYLRAVWRQAPEGLSAAGDSVIVDFDLFEGGKFRRRPSDDDKFSAWDAARRRAIDQALAEWRRRVDEMGTTFAFYQNSYRR